MESWNLGRTPFTPGWDVVGVVDKLGDKVSTWQTGQMVATLPVVGGYSEYIILSSNEMVPVPTGLDPAEAVSLVLNYITAYQMLSEGVWNPEKGSQQDKDEHPEKYRLQGIYAGLVMI